MIDYDKNSLNNLISKNDFQKYIKDFNIIKGKLLIDEMEVAEMIHSLDDSLCLNNSVIAKISEIDTIRFLNDEAKNKFIVHVKEIGLYNFLKEHNNITEELYISSVILAIRDENPTFKNEPIKEKSKLKSFLSNLLDSKDTKFHKKYQNRINSQKQKSKLKLGKM